MKKTVAEKSFPAFDDDTPPAELLAWAFATFAQERIRITTAFGMEGCVLVDLLARLGRPLDVGYVDTGFFFPETHQLVCALEKRYPHLRFVATHPLASPEEQAREHGEALWQKAPDHCCRLRKVEPMQRLLAGADAWITAIRRDQSATRGGTRLVDVDPQFGVFKIAPLATWSRQQIYDYVVRVDVPINELHFQGYPTLGCTHCTRSVDGAGAADYSRAGRWAGTLKNECGLHQAPQKENNGASS